MRTRVLPHLRDWSPVVEASVTALASRRLCRLKPETMQRILETGVDRSTRRRPSQEHLMHVVDGVLAHAPRRSANPCLVRSVAAYRVLRAAGHDVELVFGARVVDGRLDGHCWLRNGSGPIHERGGAGEPFAELYSISRTGVHAATSTSTGSRAPAFRTRRWP